MNASRKRKGPLVRAVALLTGVLFMASLGFVLYVAMVYQLSDVELTETEDGEGDPLLTLSHGEMILETDERVSVGGEICHVTMREYRLQDGRTALAVSATPAAYLERLMKEGWTPQLITGFTLAGLHAVYETLDGRAILVAQKDNAVFLIETDADEQMVYTLGSTAHLSY